MLNVQIFKDALVSAGLEFKIPAESFSRLSKQFQCVEPFRRVFIQVSSHLLTTVMLKTI